MDNFTDEEKADLKKPSLSGGLQRDFARMKNNNFEYLTCEGKPDLDRIFTFVADVNALINHATKPFKPITGTNFRI
jgi:hypothetical protein